MKRKNWIAVSMLIGATLIGGCGAAKTVEEAASGTEEITFTDALGREVTVTGHERVASLLGSFTDIWLLAGGDVVASASDAWDSLELDLDTATVVNVGSFLDPDVEQLIATKPDLVLASANTDAQVELEEVFAQAGIVTAYFDVSDFEAYLQMLDVCTDITGRKDLYEQNGLQVQAQIENVLERVDGSAPTVLFLRAASSNVKAKNSEGTVGGEMLKSLGCVNIADQDGSLLEDLSMEAIIAADPDYIFVTTQGSDTEAAMQNVEELLISNPAWQSLSAVKEDRYYVLDKKLYNNKPNAKWGEAYAYLADILYPAE